MPRGVYPKGNKGLFKKGHPPRCTLEGNKKKGKAQIGHRNYNTKEGNKKTSKIIKKMYKDGVKMGFQKGNKHFNWRDGSSFKPYSIDWTETFRRSIRERDHYICRVCKGYGHPVHHIDYDKENCNPNNLITLCKKCHNKTNYNRKYWTNYFNRYEQIRDNITNN